MGGDKAWVGKQCSLPGQTRKAIRSVIDVLGCFDESKLRYYDVRNVSQFAPF